MEILSLIWKLTHFFYKNVKNLFEQLKCLSKDGLLTRSWRCFLALGLVLMKGWILRFGETAMLGWVSCGKPNPLQQEGLEDRPFTNSLRCKMVRVRDNSMPEEFHCHSFLCARPQG